jgi:hypothetical protein
VTVFDNVVRLWGRVTPVVQARAAQDIAGHIDALIIEALDRWHADGWQRFDDQEANCTIQLYRWADDACRDTPRFCLLEIVLEWQQPTPGMLNGTESAVAMRRPDLRVRIGRANGLTIECKRLSRAAGHVMGYVDDGIRRFVTGAYAATETGGTMVGYVQTDEPPDIVDAINDRIDTHPEMGPTDILQPIPTVHPYVHRFRSEHARVELEPLALSHFLPDLR